MSWIGVAVTAAAVGVGTKAYNYYRADQRQEEAQSALNELQKTPIAKYGATPELKSFLSTAQNDVNNPTGFSGAETASYKADVAGNINTMANNAAIRSGGNLSKYVINALNPAIVMASNNFAAKNAELKRVNKQSAYGRLASAVSAFQNINNMNTQAEINRRMMIETGYGNAIAQNEAFKSNTLDSLGSDLIGAATLGISTKAKKAA